MHIIRTEDTAVYKPQDMRNSSNLTLQQIQTHWNETIAKKKLHIIISYTNSFLY